MSAIDGPVATNLGAGIVRRAFQGESDLAALAELIGICQAADALGERTSFQELRQDFVEPELGWSKAIVLWERDDHPVAFAGAWWPDVGPADRTLHLWFDALPKERSLALGSALVIWGIDRAREIIPGLQHVAMNVNEAAEWKRLILEREKFAPARDFLRMERRLEQFPAPIAPPYGYTLRALAGEQEVPGWVDLYNDAFDVHWDHMPMTAPEREQHRSSSEYLPDLDLVAVTPDGSLAGFCWCDVRRFDDGDAEYWIHLLGTGKAHRKRGLGRALLVAGLRGLAAMGATAARLAVDSESSTGAPNLYADEGFVVYERTIAYRRPIELRPLPRSVVA